MKKELEQLSESVFGGLSDSSMPIYKAVAGTTWGRLSYYLVTDLIKSIKSFNMPLINDMEDGRYTYDGLTYKDRTLGERGLRQRCRKTEKEEKRQNVDFASRYTDNVKENYRRNTARGNDINKIIRIDADKRTSSINDVELDKLMRNIVAQTNFITRYAKSNMIFRMSEDLSEVVWGDVVAAAATTAITYQNRDIEALLSENNIPNKNHGISDVGNLSIYQNKYSASFEHFSDDIENMSKSERDDNRTADIGYIEDALARKLHEQIASGFPMYMR